MGNHLEDFFQKAYEQETDRKHQLASYLPLRVTLTIIVGGILGSNVSAGGNLSSVVQYLGFGLAGIGSLSLLIAVFFLIKFHFGHAYHYLSYPDETSAFIDNLKSFHGEKLDEFENDTRNHLQKEYIECGAKNMRINDKRSSTIYRADQFLGVAAVLAMFSYWAYVGHTFSSISIASETPSVEDKVNGRSTGQTHTGSHSNTSADTARTSNSTTSQGDKRE